MLDTNWQFEIVLCYIMCPPKSYVDRAWSAYDAGDVIMILCTAWPKYTIYILTFKVQISGSVSNPKYNFGHWSKMTLNK